MKSIATGPLRRWLPPNQNFYRPTKNIGDFWEPIFGKGMRRSTFQWKKGFSVKRGEAIQWIRGFVRISTGKAIQWRGSGHSLNRRALKTEKLLSSSPSRKSTPIFGMSVILPLPTSNSSDFGICHFAKFTDKGLCHRLKAVTCLPSLPSEWPTKNTGDFLGCRYFLPLPTSNSGELVW